MSLNYKFCKKDTAEKVFVRKLKDKELEEMKAKLPNEFKGCLDNYNMRNDDDYFHIDSNDYGTDY